LLDLHADLVVLVGLDGAVARGLLVGDLQVDGRALLLQVLFLEEEAEQRRADGDAVVGGVDHQVESLLGDHLLALPRIAQPL
jgi:hypothetical protein